MMAIRLRIFLDSEVVPITLSDDEFNLLYDYLDREHSVTWDPDEVGEMTMVGKKLWDRVQEIAIEQRAEIGSST
jgi:hypothetical protein